jgi:hypothetical protein
MSARNLISAIGLALAVAAGSIFADETTWSHVPVVDTNCITKVKGDPDSHTRECALGCAKGGYGLIAEDGAYLKFDATGNALVVSALKASDRKDHLRATVTGGRKDDVIVVRSFSLD